MCFPLQQSQTDQQQHNRDRGEHRAQPGMVERIVELNPLHQTTLDSRPDFGMRNAPSRVIRCRMAAVLDDILSPAQATEKRRSQHADRSHRGRVRGGKAAIRRPRRRHRRRARGARAGARFAPLLAGRRRRRLRELWANRSAAASPRPGTTRDARARPTSSRSDAAKALSLIPGTHRFNLHAFYGDFGGKRVDRDEIGPEHFAGWIDWAKSLGIGLDFNPTFFSHPKAADNFTLAHQDAGVRKFWIRHAIACRRVGAAMGAALGTPCVTNHWIPDGMKDTPVDRLRPARASDRVAGRNLPESRRSRAQSRRARRQAVRPRHRELHGRLARVLFRLRGCPASCSTRSIRATITRRRPSPTRSAP